MTGRADYLDFYDLAKYCNDNWKGCFADREISLNAYNYKVDYDYSFENGKPTRTMLELCKLMLLDMDKNDYLDTDEVMDLWDMENIITDFLLDYVLC